MAPGGKRTGQGRARPAGANGSVDTEDIMVSSATVGGETVKTYKIKIGLDYLTPKVVGEYLFLTTIKATPQVEAATEAMAGATVADALAMHSSSVRRIMVAHSKRSDNVPHGCV